jgi:hypothetical protein
MKPYKEEEIEYLLTNYSKISKNEIIEKLQRSWGSIQKKCHKMGLKREFNEFKNDFSLKFLNFDNISCYWLGFLLADGHISKQKYIQLNLSIKDKNHIYELEKYIGHKIKIYENLTQIRATIHDKPTINEITNIFLW